MLGMAIFATVGCASLTHLTNSCRFPPFVGLLTKWDAECPSDRSNFVARVEGTRGGGLISGNMKWAERLD